MLTVRGRLVTQRRPSSLDELAVPGALLFVSTPASLSSLALEVAWLPASQVEQARRAPDPACAEPPPPFKPGEPADLLDAPAPAASRAPVAPAASDALARVPELWGACALSRSSAVESALVHAETSASKVNA